MRAQLIVTNFPLAPGDTNYPRAWGTPATPLPQPSSGGTAGMPTIAKVGPIDRSKPRTAEFNAPFSVTERITDFFNGLGFSAKPRGQQREDVTNEAVGNRSRVGQASFRNDGPIPDRIPRFFTPAISSWDGPSQRGFSQFNYRLNMKKPAIPRATTNARVISGILARPMGAGKQRIPAVYVPTSIT